MIFTKESVSSYADKISNEIFITIENGFEKRPSTIAEKALVFNVISATIEAIEYSIDTDSISEDEKEKIITASADTAESIVKRLIPYADTLFSIYYPIKEYFETE